MATEILRPTAVTTGGTQTRTNPTYAYDANTSTYAKLITSGTILAERSGTTTYTTFQSRTQTWTSANLIISAELSTTGEVASGVEIHYSLDGGSNYYELALLYGLDIFWPLDAYSIAIPADQNIANVRVRVTTIGGSDEVSASGVGTADVYDVRIEGTYTGDTFTSFTANPTTINFGGTTQLTCVFTGSQPSVSGGYNSTTWGTWQSGVAKTTSVQAPYYGNSLSLQWTAIQANTKYANVTVRTPSGTAPTYSKNPCTVGETITIGGAVISNCDAPYNTPLFNSTSGRLSWNNNQAIALSRGTDQVYYDIYTSGYRVYAASNLTIYAAPEISMFLAGQISIFNGQSTYVTCTFANLDPGSARIGTTSGGTQVTANAVSGNSYTVSPTSTTTYYLRVLNAAGYYVESSVQITVNTAALPSITNFYASPSPVAPGGPSYLYPVFTNANPGDAVIGTTPGGNNIATDVVSGQSYAVYPSVDTIYYLTVWNVVNQSVSAQCTVTMLSDDPYITSFNASPASITTGNSSNLQPVYTNPDPGSARIGTTQGGTQITANAVSGNNYPVSPTAHTTYYLRVINASNEYVDGNVTVYVYAAPIATSLVASNNNPLYGATITLTPTFSGGSPGSLTARIGSSGNQSSDVTASAVSGTPVSSAAITSAKTFTLSVANQASTWAYASSAQVVPQTVVVADISPAAPTVAGWNTQVFTSSVSGAVNTGITWSCTDGTIVSGQGTNTLTWRAPLSAGSVTLTATSQADGTKLKQTTITVTAASIQKSRISSTLSR